MLYSYLLYLFYLIYSFIFKKKKKTFLLFHFKKKLLLYTNKLINKRVVLRFVLDPNPRGGPCNESQLVL